MLSKSDLTTGIALLLPRLALGTYFVIAGFRKITGEGGVKAFVEGGFAKSTPSWLPGFIATPYGYALPFVEVAIGITFAIGLLGRVSAAIIGLMLLSFIMAMGPGHASFPFHPNVIYITVAILILLVGPGRLSVDGLVLKRKGV